MTSTYRIGVIADTHNRLVPRVATLFAGVDEIWHLGDVCNEEILDELRGIQPRLTVVLGNNDFGLDYPITRRLERGGEIFELVHIPPRRWPEGPGWLLYGHTHRPHDEVINGLRVFNPGSAGRANKGAPASVAFLVSENGAPFSARIVLL